MPTELGWEPRTNPIHRLMCLANAASKSALWSHYDITDGGKSIDESRESHASLVSSIRAALGGEQLAEQSLDRLATAAVDRLATDGSEPAVAEEVVRPVARILGLCVRHPYDISLGGTAEVRGHDTHRSALIREMVRRLAEPLAPDSPLRVALCRMYGSDPLGPEDWVKEAGPYEPPDDQPEWWDEATPEERGMLAAKMAVGKLESGAWSFTYTLARQLESAGFDPAKPHLWPGLADYFAMWWIEANDIIRDNGGDLNELEVPPARISSPAEYEIERQRFERYCLRHAEQLERWSDWKSPSPEEEAEAYEGHEIAPLPVGAPAGESSEGVRGGKLPVSRQVEPPPAPAPSTDPEQRDPAEAMLLPELMTVKELARYLGKTEDAVGSFLRRLERQGGCGDWFIVNDTPRVNEPRKVYRTAVVLRAWNERRRPSVTRPTDDGLQQAIRAADSIPPHEHHHPDAPVGPAALATARRPGRRGADVRRRLRHRSPPRARNQPAAGQRAADFSQPLSFSCSQPLSGNGGGGPWVTSFCATGRSC